ncbi:response regulator [Deinococcus malanensis]|uniref:Response regulator n=1 Tax=Deinococcus malanensis TaxID=1706855 RepID=A0ABQ2F531_9DEIO|nr:response regulator [Deinococcus malanensis]GGK40860.1 response regulator [Deinococcus malanensis]
MDAIPQHYLLIDDSPTDRLLAQEAFAQLQPESTLTRASSGAEPLELLKSGSWLPDVILLDINMPGLTGFQVLAWLKDQRELRGIPVVMLSTSNAKQDIREAYSLHASSYLVKLATFDDFVAQVEAFLEYWKAARAAYPYGHQSA